MSHFIGIDNSSLSHRVCVIGPDSNVLSSFDIENSFDGFSKLEKVVGEYEAPLIGFELPHGPLIDYLRSRNYQLYSLNPLKIKRFKEIHVVSGNKNDNIDAHAIGEYLRQNLNSARPMKFNSAEVEKLKTLSIIYDRLVSDRTRHLNKLRFSVRQYFPLHDKLFTNFGCSVQLKLLSAYPTHRELSQVKPSDLRRFLVAHHYCRPDHIDKLIARIQQYNQIIPDELVEAYQIEAQCLCSIIETLSERIAEIEHEMRDITRSHPIGKCLRSVPGVGDVLAGLLLGLLGDNKERFDSANGMQCLFGTAPKNYQSGPYHKVTMRRSCNKYARAILYRFAFSSMLHAQWAREYYDIQRARGKTHSVAVRALSNKWVRILYRLWKDEISYDERRKEPVAA